MGFYLFNYILLHFYLKLLLIFLYLSLRLILGYDFCCFIMHGQFYDCPSFRWKRKCIFRYWFLLFLENILAANIQKEGVVQLDSGLQYKVLRKGNGKFHPTVDSPCECHYAGQLIDGTEFDSSYKRGSPTTFAPNQVIKGWTEAMQLMVEGDKWEMYIPSDLAYGDGGRPPTIPRKAVLVFQVWIVFWFCCSLKMEIIKIKGNKKPAKEEL